jgi:hypothetical protein
MLGVTRSKSISGEALALEVVGSKLLMTIGGPMGRKITQVCEGHTRSGWHMLREVEQELDSLLAVP